MHGKNLLFQKFYTMIGVDLITELDIKGRHSMTENLFQKLEEKMMTLLTEMDDLRKEIQHLAHENTALKAEKDNHAKKLQDLILLLDSVSSTETTLVEVAAA